MHFEQVLSQLFTGLLAGALTFVSFVDTRTYLTLCNSPETSSHLKDIFPIWWPAGRDLMVPLLIMAATSNGFAYWVNNGGWQYVVAICCMVFIGLWTAVVMGEDIGKLMRAKEMKSIRRSTRKFCTLHHVRLVVALAAYLCVLTV